MSVEIKNLIESYCDSKRTLREKLIAEIKQMLTAFSNNRLVFREMDEDTYDEYQDTMFTSVSYDGGNHPEYASNCFSELHGAFLDDNGDVNLIIEDSDEYSIDRVWGMEELVDVYYAIEFFFDNK